MTQSSDASTITPRPRRGWAVAAVTALQLLIWILSNLVLDGGRVLTWYSLLLISYWLLIGAARLSGRGAEVSRLVVGSGWLPPVLWAVIMCCGVPI